jgi:transcriptional regulator with XRE-family HTH domain
MDLKKLSELITEKRASRRETQREFAEYFSELAGRTVSYGFIQSLEKGKKSVPEWGNLKVIAKMWDVSLSELDLYLENDSITDIREVNSAYKKLNQTITADSALSIVKDNLTTDERFQLAMTLIEDCFDSAKEKIMIAQAESDHLKETKALSIGVKDQSTLEERVMRFLSQNQPLLIELQDYLRQIWEKLEDSAKGPILLAQMLHINFVNVDVKSENLHKQLQEIARSAQNLKKSIKKMLNENTVDSSLRVEELSSQIFEEAKSVWLSRNSDDK